jgi:hypothetical protein
MTPQEAQMLQDLVRKVEGTPLNEKDPDAEALLQDGLARDPDAIYKLAQTVLIQNLALEQAHTQMQRMQQQLVPQQQPARATSFLGGLLHHNAPQSAPPPQYQAAPQYQAGPPYQAGNYPPPPAYGGYGAPSSGGGFLRSAATTAAGVAGGMLAFQGIESLMHGGMGGGFGGGMPVEETVVNNYYDESPQQANSGRAGDSDDPNAGRGGQDMQPQGPYDDGGADPGSDQGSDQGDAQDYVDDSGGGDFGGGGDGSDFV